MSDRVQIGGGVLSNRGLEAAMKAHRDSVSPTNRQMIAEAIVAYQRNAIELTSEGEAAECIACEGSPKAPNIPCAICGRSPAPQPAQPDLERFEPNVGEECGEYLPVMDADPEGGYVKYTDAQTQIAALTAKVEELTRRIGPADPGGSDRIDELESANDFLKHRAETADAAEAILRSIADRPALMNSLDIETASAIHSAIHPEKEGE